MMETRFRIGDLVSSFTLRGFGIYMGATSGSGGLLHEFVWFHDHARLLCWYDVGIKALCMRRA